MKPEINGIQPKLRLAARKPPAGGFDTAASIELTGIFFQVFFSIYLTLTTTQTYHCRGSVFFLFLKLILFRLKRHKLPVLLYKLSSLRSSRWQLLRVQYFSMRETQTGGFFPLSHQCAIFPHQESRLKGIADFFWRIKGIQRSHCKWGKTWCLFCSWSRPATGCLFLEISDKATI